MNYLLDTHLLLWLLYKPQKLPLSAKSLLQPVATSLYYISISFAEIAIKQRTGKLEFSGDLREMQAALVQLRVAELPLTAFHTFALTTLPLVHKDPFDRLLVAQAQSEAVTLLTVNRVLTSYGPAVMVVR